MLNEIYECTPWRVSGSGSARNNKAAESRQGRHQPNRTPRMEARMIQQSIDLGIAERQAPVPCFHIVNILKNLKERDPGPAQVEPRGTKKNDALNTKYTGGNISEIVF